MATYNIIHNTHEILRYDFELTDERGRAIGYIGGLQQVEVVASDLGYAALKKFSPGSKVWRLNAQAARDGFAFGASHGSAFYPSRELAEMAFHATADKARARYAKKYSK